MPGTRTAGQFAARVLRQLAIGFVTWAGLLAGWSVPQAGRLATWAFRKVSSYPPGRVAAVCMSTLVLGVSALGAQGFVGNAALQPVTASSQPAASPARADSLAARPAEGASHPSSTPTARAGATGKATGAPSGADTVAAAGGAESHAASTEATLVPPARSGSGRRVVFDQSDQRVWLVKANGQVQRTYLVSGSKFDQLKPGQYEVYSTSRHATSYKGGSTMQYMVRFTRGATAAIGFHDIPRSADGSPVQTREQLGTRLSDGCIRQARPDAVALWEFAPVGTKIVVVA